MKRQLSIKTVLILSFVSLCGLLILGYSILSARFFSHGAARVIMDNMEITVDNHLRSVSPKNRKPVDYWGNYRITADWKYMPEAVKNTFPAPIPPSGKLCIASEPGFLGSAASTYYVLAVRKENITYYVSLWTGFSTPPGIFGWNSNGNIRFLVVLSCFISMGIAAVLWLITRHISQPMIALSQWAKRLDKNTVKKKLPEFHYQELNELALLLRAKIAAEHDTLEREHQFLHYASHELRTPITIIRQNIEVLEKVRGLDTESARAMEQKAVKRLGRASDNIGTLMETLLWMGRKRTDDIIQREIRIDSLLLETIEALQFLLKGKQINVEINVSPAVIEAPEAPLRIVLANLIRNAFLHTACGMVTIEQTAGNITILNEDFGDHATGNLGFGFGLSLTSKLIRRMGWPYQNIKGPRGHKVVIRIGGVTPYWNTGLKSDYSINIKQH